MFFGRLVRLLLSLLFLTLSTCVCAVPHTVASAAQHTQADKIQISGITDAGKVNEFLYRGAQRGNWPNITISPFSVGVMIP
jgi:hypothetical protein